MAATVELENVGAVMRPRSPYVGLVPYDEADAAFFFGRSTEAAIVAMNLRTARLTILYGPSGVGKTSLLMAGAVHGLREEVRDAGAESPFAVCVFRSWRDDPARGLQDAAQVGFEEVFGAEPLPPPAATLAETLRTWTAGTRTLLVVFDQFEEYFQYHPDEGDDERLTGFAAELARIVNDPTLPVHVLLSIREDAWAKLDLFEGHVPALFANYVRVDHLDLDAAREAIERPIDAWNRTLADGEQPYEIEPALTDAVLAATTGGSLTLTSGGESTEAEAPGDRVEAPFLQLVLDRLWRETAAAGERTLTLARLEALGGAARIVENHLLDALGRLTPAEQETASDCFRFLVSRSRTKIAHSASDLAEWTGRPESQVTPVLDKLCTGESGRILRAVAPAQEDSSPSYELFHDILAEPILDWRRSFEQERAHRLALRRFARIGAVLLALVAAFGALGVWALLQRSDARRATASATSLALDSAARDQLAAHPEVSLLLALDAYRAHRSPQSTSTMITALQTARRSGAEAILRGHAARVSSVAFSSDGRTIATGDEAGTVRLWDVQTHRQLGAPIGGQTHRIMNVAFSPDGATLATATENGTVRLWNVQTHAALGQPLRARLYVRSDYPHDIVAFTQAGRILAATADDNRMGLWDVRARTRLAQPVRPEPLTVLLLPGVAFSADARLLVTVDYDGIVRVWSVSAKKQVDRWATRIESGSVSSIALSPNAQVLAIGNVHGVVRLWNVRTHEQLRPALRGHRRAVMSIAFGRDGGTLATGGADETVRLWDLRTHRMLGPPLGGHTGQVLQVAVSPDGSTIASAGADRTVRLWNLRAPIRLGRALRGNVGRYEFSNIVAFSADGSLLAGASSDRSVRVWSVRTRGEPGHALSPGRSPPGASCRTTRSAGGVVRVCLGPAAVAQPDGTRAPVAGAFTADGRRLATVDDDGTARLWDPRMETPARSLRPKVGEVYATAFSPDGRTLAAAGDTAVRLYDVRTGRALGRLRAGANALVFSPDGRTLATGGDSVIRLWDVIARRSLGKLVGQKGLIAAIAFSPDGHTLASGSVDRSVQLWDVDTRTALGQPLRGHSGTVYGLAFSPDGRTLATGSDDETLRLWDVHTHARLGAPLRGTEGTVWSAAFSPDGTTIASSGEDGRVRLWRGILWRDRTNLAHQVCSLVTGNLTKAEWETLAPQLAYRTTCPG